MVDYNRDGGAENSAETENDNNTSMSNYDFIASDDDAQDDNNDEQFNVVGNKWTLGDHSTASDVDRSGLTESINDTIKSLDDDIDGDMKDVLQDASKMVQNTRVSKFECPVEDCGLGHSHSDHKHDVRDAFNVLDSFTDGMQFCPYCHCGVNELSMLMTFFPYINKPVFTDQQKFEGVFEVDPDVLGEVYRLYSNEDLTVEGAIREVSNNYGLPTTSLVPMDVREDIKRFFSRRRGIEKAGQAAPIAQETRQAIENNRVSLEEVTSQ